MNVAHYAYADSAEEGAVTVSYAYRPDPPRLVVELADAGVPFDPPVKEDAAPPDDITAVPVGGLGSSWRGGSVDALSCRREDGRNIVTMEKAW